MTNILYSLTNLPSTINTPMLINKPITLNNKSSATLFIQPPSLTSNQPNTLLTKRVKAVELGDLLMKKIKSKSTRSEEYLSPNRSGFEESNNISPESCQFEQEADQSPMFEAVASPSAQLMSAELEIPPVQKLSSHNRSSLIPGKLLVRSPENEAKYSQMQVQQALSLLQKKIFLQQVASITEALFKDQLSKQPLSIPPFMTSTEPVKVTKEMFSFNNGEDDAEIIIGPVEYPLLSMAPNEESQKAKLCVPTTLLNYAKTPNRVDRSMLESLCVTRAETQRSESEEGSSAVGEDLVQAVKGRKKKATKAKDAEKVKTVQKKEVKTQRKPRGSQKKNNSCLSEISQSP